MRIREKLFISVLAASLIFTGGGPGRVTAVAAEKTGSLTLDCEIDGSALKNVTGKIYKVADPVNGRFVLTEDFKNSAAAVNDLASAGSEAKRKTAEALALFAQANNVSSVSDIVTDSKGTYKKTGLSQGLYLVVYDGFSVKYSTGTVTYTFSPYLLSIPNWVDNELIYDITSNAKGVKDTKPDTPDNPPDNPKKTNVSVLKHWVDSGNTASRPESISVTLYKDGKAAETASLDAANNWRFFFKDLEDGHKYAVLENSVAGN